MFLVNLHHCDVVSWFGLAGFTCPNGASYAANPEPLKFDCRLWRAARLHSEETLSDHHKEYYILCSF
jgi:hypothetical protein